MAGDVMDHVARDDAREQVVASAHRRADEHAQLLAAVEVGDVLRARRGGGSEQRQQNKRLEATHVSLADHRSPDEPSRAAFFAKNGRERPFAGASDGEIRGAGASRIRPAVPTPRPRDSGTKGLKYLRPRVFCCPSRAGQRTAWWDGLRRRARYRARDRMHPVGRLSPNHLSNSTRLPRDLIRVRRASPARARIGTYIERFWSKVNI